MLVTLKRVLTRTHTTRTHKRLFWGSSGPQVFTEDKVFPFSKEDTFLVLASVDKYQEFLPWCFGSKVLNFANREAEVLLTLGNESMKQDQKAIVSFEKPSKVGISMVDNPDSPLKSFDLKWELQEVAPNKTNVKLHLSYDFRSSLHQMMAGSIFQNLQKTLVSDFEKQCKKVLPKE
eukprot:TRINITY_DN11735_c0_g1_i1.p1 TRINITY_DN11735_c0_g1~~TRINITY_DN11735_c0_g1_i1.p1  ORF type:complete len:176 (-),score=37.44 TRINITY_DN11735_c0_g1_i1:33-560(-)